MNSFPLRIKTLEPATHEVSVFPSTTVAALKNVVAALAGVPAHRQRLIWRGRVINDAQTLEELGEDLGHGGGERGGRQWRRRA
jgi:hypothetical protein